MGFAPQPRALFWWPRCQECPEPEAVLTFWLRNVLCATAACSSWTSQLPKVLRAWGVFTFPYFPSNLPSKFPIFSIQFSIQCSSSTNRFLFPSNGHHQQTIVCQYFLSKFQFSFQCSSSTNFFFNFPFKFPSDVRHQLTISHIFHPKLLINQPFVLILHPIFHPMFIVNQPLSDFP